jgi:hypothetical protein
MVTDEDTKPARKKAPVTSKSAPKPKTEPGTNPEREALLAKEHRGRVTGSPHAGRDPRPLPPEPDLPDAEAEEAKRQWKEARNMHPTQTSVPKNRPEPPKPEPKREPTAQEIRDKAERGLVRYPTSV